MSVSPPVVRAQQPGLAQRKLGPCPGLTPGQNSFCSQDGQAWQWELDEGSHPDFLGESAAWGSVSCWKEYLTKGDLATRHNIRVFFLF